MIIKTTIILHTGHFPPAHLLKVPPKTRSAAIFNTPGWKFFYQLGRNVTNKERNTFLDILVFIHSIIHLKYYVTGIFCALGIERWVEHSPSPLRCPWRKKTVTYYVTGCSSWGGHVAEGVLILEEVKKDLYRRRLMSWVLKCEGCTGTKMNLEFQTQETRASWCH